MSLKHLITKLRHHFAISDAKDPLPNHVATINDYIKQYREEKDEEEREEEV